MAHRLLGVLRGQPIALLALFVALSGSSYAAVNAGKVGQGDVIVGCVAKDGKLRVVASASRCSGKETAIAFNREGRPGEDGADGATGPAGQRGSAGATGPTGSTGLTGADGPAGPAGSTGAAGPTGPAGSTGATGPAGATGTTGAAGQSVASSVEGAGANCTAGGVKLVSASGTNYVCNGTDTAAAVLTKLKTVDGSGSGLDADLVDGLDIGTLFGTGPQGTDMGASAGGVDAYMGQVELTANTFPPPGFMFAAGQTLPISQYQALFALLGTTYGGNGSTTFRVPDLRKQAPGGTAYILCYQGVFPSRS
jgi:Phage Tail Collar Domain/Collagen triple helix repeat (20 copies)